MFEATTVVKKRDFSLQTQNVLFSKRRLYCLYCVNLCAILEAINCSSLLVTQSANTALPKAQRTQGIEYFDSFNGFILKQKPQHALTSWSNFSLILFDKGQEKQRITLTNPCNNFNKSICSKFDKSI